VNRVMLIPAAGRGSRLGASMPKVLFPVNGRPMIDYLLDLYAPVVDGFVLVVHPSAEAMVRAHCRARSTAVEYDVQMEPTGMLDAILIPGERVRRLGATSVWITWCDQIAVHPETITTLAAHSSHHPECALVFPTVARRAPYIHLVRDARGEIVAIRQRREGDAMPEVGESDVGLFCLSAAAYHDLLPQFARIGEAGSVTSERNFLPFIPWLGGRAEVRTFPARDEIESLGVNTPEDVQRLEAYGGR
jgi:bifunctional UDP-N-acetylglucosamine pyrophosphorylase / glucosamine-1-phosphate N-acetyltransferase